MGGAFALAKRIGMPAEAIAKLETVQGVDAQAALLHGIDTFEQGAEALHAALGPDEGGWKILSVMLEEAAKAEAEYQRRGIPEIVYIDTMSAFTRFVSERKAGYGEYGFDRYWWTGHQISLKLFRIGLLEYELCDGERGREISIHIPSGRPLLAEDIDVSLKEAHAFMQMYYPAYSEAPYVCNSWLLAPALREILPPSSRILAFADRFEIRQVFAEEEGYRFFVFGRDDKPVEELPERTSLQRALKAYMLGGGKVGAAYGILKERPI